MAYMYDAQRSIHLVAGASLPREVLLSYHDDDEQTKVTIRSLWQALRIYGQCWLLAEPLEQGSDLYKCRFSTSIESFQPKTSLSTEPQSYLYLFSHQQVLEILSAPVTPIEWVVMTDAEGNKCPVNVAEWNKDLWQLEGEAKALVPSPAQTCGGDDDGVVKQPVQQPSQDKRKDLATYKERKSEEPVDTHYEQVAKTTIHEAMRDFYPEQIAAGQMPPRKYLPLILVKAVQKTLEHQLEYERDPRQRTALQQRIEDLDLMIQKEKLWYWDRERYVKALWTDELTGVCAVNVGIHPRLRVRNDASLRQKKKSSKRKYMNAKQWHAKRARARGGQRVA